MSRVKPIPDGVPVVMPMLVCRDASTAIDFCKITFGAVELVRRPGPDGTVAHAALTIGGAMIMIEGEFPTLSSRAPQPDGSSPVVIYVYVEDVDTVIERARLVDRPQDHVWTSHRSYLGQAPQWLAAKAVLRRFGTERAEAVRRFHSFVMGEEEKPYERLPRRAAVVVGDVEFARQMLTEMNLPDLLHRLLTVETVSALVADQEKTPLEELTGPGRARHLSRARALSGYLGRQVGNIPLAQTARFFRRDPSTLSRDVAYLEAAMKKSPDLARTVSRLEKTLRTNT